MKDGYTPIANDVLDKLLTVHLSANQWQVLLCIIRKTCGFQKTVDHIANSQIVKSTGLCKAVVSRSLHRLQEMNLIHRTGKSIGLQEHWEQWEKLAELQTIETKEPPKMRIVRSDGYIGIWRGAVEPKFQSMATKQGYILEHRLIMARILGRCLEPWEVVHHKDGVPSHNSEDNLELLPSQTEHMPSMLAQQRIKQLEAQLAKLQSPVDEKLVPSTVAISPSTVAERSTKVSSPAVAQKKKETIQKKGYKSIFDFWNEQKIQVHRTLTQDMRSVIVRTLRSYSVEETCKAIANYAEILHGQEYYWTYKWTLVDFLKRGLVKFMDLEVARANYRGDGGKDGKAKLSRAYKSADDHYGRSKTA